MNCNSIVKRGLMFALAVGMVCGGPISARAATLNEIKKEKQEAQKKKQQAESNLEAVQENIDSLSEEKAAVEEEVEELDEILVDLLIEVDLLNADIEDKKAAIEQAKKDYEVALENERKQQEAMALRIKYMYEKGNQSYLEILLESKDMGEAVNRVNYTEKLYAYDRMLLEKFHLAKEQVAEAEAKYENELSELEEVEEDYEIQKEHLNQLIEQKQNTLSDFSKQLANAKALAGEYQKQIKAQTDDLKRINQEEQDKIAEEARKKALEEAQKKAEAAAKKKLEEDAKKNLAKAKNEEDSSEGSDNAEIKVKDNSSETITEKDTQDKNKDKATDGTTEEAVDNTDSSVTVDTKEEAGEETTPSKQKNKATGSGIGTDIANYALQFVGNPYVSGGTSLTNGCDCSGFTQSVYSEFGISIPRSSYSQSTGGTEVSYSNIQAGDIIYYGGHVAIYIGNDQIVHASTPSTGIKISSAFYRSIVTIRRYY